MGAMTPEMRRRYAGNCELHMTGFDDRDLADVVKLAFGGDAATWFREREGHLEFTIYSPPPGAGGWSKLPCPLGAEEALPIIRRWLGGVGRNPEPDHDGSNSEGWTVRAWGTGDVLCTVTPEWLEHHK